MKKVVCISLLLFCGLGLIACNTCENTPIIQENHKLIVPPHFGQIPK